VAVLALAATSCGAGGHGGGTPQATGSALAASSAPAASGVVTMPAGKATQAALAALTAAHGVQVRGTFTANGRVERFTMRFAGSSAASGSFTVKGAPVQLITCACAMYLKAGQDGWAAMGNPAGTAGMMAGRWFKAGPAEVPGTFPLSLAFFTAELSAHATMAPATVTAQTLAGHRVAVIAYPDGSKLYVAAAGRPYPLRFDVTGDTGGRRDFSDYESTARIVPPSGATGIGGS
jgi:hypothetical protein